MKQGMMMWIKKNNRWIIAAGILFILSLIRYFYNLTAYPSIYNDERHSFDIVTGLINSGKLYKWDWATNSLSDTVYIRAWPYTLFLSIWIRLFGSSLLAIRASSAFLGCMFIMSYIYITKKWFNDLVITILGSLLLLMDTALTFHFRYVRMYSLWVLLFIWTMYFLHQGISKTGKIKKKTTLFNYPYLIVGLILFYVSYETHINTLGLILGVIVYIFVKAFLTKKNENGKKYKCLSFSLILLILICFSCYLLYIWKILPETGNIISTLCRRINLFTAGFTNIRTEYFDFQIKYLGEYIITIIVLLCGMCGAIISHKKKEAFLWLISIYIINLIFFVFLTNRYYTKGYAIFLNFITATLCAYGFSFLFRHYRRKGFILSLAVILLCCINNFSSDQYEIYSGKDCCNYTAGIEMIDMNLLKEDTAIVQFGLYSKYLYNDISEKHPELETVYLNGYKKEAFPYDNLMKIAQEYPQGLLLCEENKFNTSASSEFRKLFQVTDPICNPSLDSFHFYIHRYHFIIPSKKDIKEGKYNENIGCAWRNIDEEYNKGIEIYIHKDTIEPNVDFISVTVDMQGIQKKYQLVINGYLPNEEGYYLYEIPLGIEETISPFIPRITDYDFFYRYVI